MLLILEGRNGSAEVLTGAREHSSGEVWGYLFALSSVSSLGSHEHDVSKTQLAGRSLGHHPSCRVSGCSVRPGTLHPLTLQGGLRVAQQARYRLAGWRAKEVMLMSFKIRMKMFIAESRTCVSAESCGKGTALSQPFGFIFAHSLFICWWCCLTGP